ncbi:unnamed protein product [Brassica rapa subsp. trilocularis]
MGFIDGKSAPVIIMIIVINMINGLVNALTKKVLDGGINHMIIATYRLGISTFFLLPIAYFWERNTRPKLTTSISFQLFVSGLFGASLMQYFYLLGLSYTSATLGSAFWGTLPAITFILALIFRFEKLSVKTKAGYGVVLGAMISLAGALILTLYQGIPLSNPHEHATISHIQKGHENWIKGCFLLSLGVIFFSSWMLIQAKVNVSYPCPYSGTVILSVFGTLQCALLSLIKTRHVEDWILRDKLTIITVIIAGVGAQGMCTVGISWCIKQRGPVFTSAFSPVTLMFATVFDFLILHRIIYLGRFEKLSVKTKAGYGVVLGAMISLAGALILTLYQGIPLSNPHEHATISHIQKGHENWIKGCFLLSLGVIFFSSWMLIQAKVNVSYPCPYSGTVILSVFGTLQCALLSLIKTRHVEDWILRDKLTIITVIIAGVGAQGMCTVGISWCIKQRGPVFTSAFSPVTLMFATVFDFLILHRIIYLGSVIGSVVVIIGLYIFLWSKRKQIDISKITKLPTTTVKEGKEEEDHTNVNN